MHFFVQISAPWPKAKMHEFVLNSSTYNHSVCEVKVAKVALFSKDHHTSMRITSIEQMVKPSTIPAIRSAFGNNARMH